MEGEGVWSVEFYIVTDEKVWVKFTWNKLIFVSRKYKACYLIAMSPIFKCRVSSPKLLPKLRRCKAILDPTMIKP